MNEKKTPTWFFDKRAESHLIQDAYFTVKIYVHLLLALGNILYITRKQDAVGVIQLVWQKKHVGRFMHPACTIHA